MTETVSVVLAANQWTAISGGQADVTAQLATIGVARVYVGAAAPAGPDVGLIMTQSDTLSLSGIIGNVYLRALDEANRAQVVRG